jgi:adenine-specific DNA-methyltransferase
MATADLTETQADALARAERRRTHATHSLDPVQRRSLGQYFTPAPIARQMASMFEAVRPDSIRLLDPGAGSGSLTTALVQTICEWDEPPDRIIAVLMEVDPALEAPLRETLADCETRCGEVGVTFDGSLRIADFLQETALGISSGQVESFDLAILNPPYRKISAESQERAYAAACGVRVSNLYAAFVAATLARLEEGAQMVAITPRSFTNGTYFRQFRRFLVGQATLEQLHVFDSRDRAFADDGVLQENLILRARRGPGARNGRVDISASPQPGGPVRTRRVDRAAVVNPKDPELFIRIPVDEEDASIATAMAQLPASLDELGLSVSTGPIVDFRLREHLCSSKETGDAVPLLYPMNLDDSRVTWPIDHQRKPQGIRSNDETRRWLVPDGTYVLVRRFSAKEERRRVVAAVLEREQLPSDLIGFENHLNYFHRDGAGLDSETAFGLAAYLNSKFVDSYVRLFNGHTQVNAADLRALRYPSLTQLAEFASLEDSAPKVNGLITQSANGPRDGRQHLPEAHVLFDS